MPITNPGAGKPEEQSRKSPCPGGADIQWRKEARHNTRTFPRVPVVRTVCFYCRDTGWSLLENKILQVAQKGPKKERDSTIYDVISTSDPCSDKQYIIPTQNKSGGVG